MFHFRFFLISSIVYTLTLAVDFNERPTFPEVFSTHVEGLLKDQKTELDAEVYFDRVNNRAAVDLLFQKENTKFIYDFNRDLLLTINQDRTCTASAIGGQSGDQVQFFQYNVDEKTKRKTLAPAEESLFFKNSEYDSEDDTGDIPMYVYKTSQSVPAYGIEDCIITHKFTKPEVTMADCDVRRCNPKLYKVVVECQSEGESLHHNYYFTGFRSFINDVSIFQVPPGVYCPIKSDRKFPIMPLHFCLTYDFAEELLDVEGNTDNEISYKSLCYDAPAETMRVNNYNNSGMTSVQTYDFIQDVGASFDLYLNQCTIGPITDELSVGEASSLPDEIFPFSMSTEYKNVTVTYQGLRIVSGVTFHIWASKSEITGIREVKDFYFSENGKDSKGVPILQLNRIMAYSYESLQGDKTLTLNKISYTNIGHLKTIGKDLSVFNVATCYPKDKRKDFQIIVRIGCDGKDGKVTLCLEDLKIQQGTSLYNSVYESLYDLLVSTAGVPIMRISGLQMTSIAGDTIAFEGSILESPSEISEEIVDIGNVVPADAAYSKIEARTNAGRLTDIISDNGQAIRFVATSFRAPIIDSGITREPTGKQYTEGSMAALGVIMALAGILIGAVVMFVYVRQSSSYRRETS